MNSGVNALGQGNRANATIGRALQLVDPQRRRRPARARSTGPRSATPASTRSASPRTRPARRGSRCRSSAGFPPGTSAVTLFAGEGVRGVVDQLSRDARVAGPVVRRRACGRVAHPKLAIALRRDAGGVARARPGVPRGGLDARPGSRAELDELLQLARRRAASGAPAASPRGCPTAFAGATLPKFRAGGLLIVHAGGGAGLFSADHRRLGQRRGRQRAGHEGGRAHDDDADPCSTRPASGRRPTATLADRGRRRSTALTVGLLDITKPRGDVFLDRLEALLRRAGPAGRALRQADVHQAGARRPAPRDRHQVRRGDRGARRLRLAARRAVCTTSSISRAGACPGVFVASTEFVDAAEAQAGRSASEPRARVRAPPDPGPHRRRDAAPWPTPRWTTSWPPSPSRVSRPSSPGAGRR